MRGELISVLAAAVSACLFFPLGLWVGRLLYKPSEDVYRALRELKIERDNARYEVTEIKGRIKRSTEYLEGK